MIDLPLIVLCIIAYLVGSIPSGFIIARAKGIRDVREHGSGNIGATNVARMLGIYYFFVVFFCDFFKAFIYLRLLSWYGYSEYILIVAAAALLIGNAFPLFLGFRGGKAVATSVGVFLALQPMLVMYAFVCWLIVFLATRTVGTASVITLLFMPLYFFVQACAGSLISCFIIFVVLFGLYLHRNNIRLFLGLITGR
jgi:glycerol-3-phosphate acyltransferase PlsY